MSESREVVIRASVDDIMAVLVDLESLPQWSPAHQSVEVLATDGSGRPTRSKQKVKTAGVIDEQIIDYTWNDDGVSWTLDSAKQQRSQDARYTLTPEGGKTRVTFDLTVDPVVPLPGFLLKRAAKGLMETATDGLAKRVASVNEGD